MPTESGGDDDDDDDDDFNIFLANFFSKFKRNRGSWNRQWNVLIIGLSTVATSTKNIAKVPILSWHNIDSEVAMIMF